MAVFIGKKSKQVKSDLLPYIGRNKVLIILCTTLLYLLIDTNIRLRRVETEGAFHYYNLTLDRIEQNVDSIDSTLSGPMGSSVESDIEDVQSDIRNLENQLNDIQKKVDDLWFKLY